MMMKSNVSFILLLLIAINIQQELLAWPYDCDGAKRKDPAAQGIVRIYLNASDIVGKEVYCDFNDDGSWLVLTRRTGVLTALNYEKPWADYKNGFGSLTRELWLGNEWFHFFTSQEFFNVNEAILEVKMTDKNGGSPLVARYNTFQVGNEADKYNLTLGGLNATTSSIGNKFGLRHSGMSFSTMDRDNDLHDTTNCADHYQCGWWFNGCVTVCFTCKTSHFKYGNGGTSVSLKSAEMKLQTKSVQLPGEWSPWSACSCATSERNRTLACYARAVLAAECDMEDREPCEPVNCPVDGAWSEWSNETCTVCGERIQFRNRSCNNPAPVNGGADCVGSGADNETCNSQACPVSVDNGNWAPWTNISIVGTSPQELKDKLIDGLPDNCYVVGDHDHSTIEFEWMAKEITFEIFGQRIRKFSTEAYCLIMSQCDSVYGMNRCTILYEDQQRIQFSCNGEAAECDRIKVYWISRGCEDKSTAICGMRVQTI